MYSGPIVYLVHFPVSMSTLTDENNVYASENYKAHMGKMYKLIQFAEKRDVPIVLEVAHSPVGDIQLELLRKFCAERNIDLGTFKLIDEFPARNNFLSELFEHLELKSTKVILGGWTKERCILNSIEALRRYSKDLELVLLRGNFTLAARNFKHYSFVKEKAEFKKVIANNKVKRSVLKKSLLQERTIRHNSM